MSTEKKNGEDKGIHGIESVETLKEELLKLQQELQEIKTRGEDGSLPVKEAVKEKGPSVVYVATDRQLRRFGGEDGVLEEWISDVESFLVDRPHQTSRERLQTVIKYTHGAARMELTSRGDVQTAEDAFRVLKEVFGDVGTAASQKRKFFSRIQKGGETLIEYSHELIRLLQTWKGIDEKDRDEILISQFIEGVGDPDLRRELLRRSHEKPGPFVHLRDWAVQWEKQGYGRRKHVQPPKAEVHEQATSSMSLVLEALQQQSQLVSNLLSQQEEQNKALHQILGQQNRQRWPPGCFQCGAKDHIRRNCPQVQRNLNE